MFELVVHVTGKFPNHVRKKARFSDSAPSREWLNEFLQRYATLQLKSMKDVEDECLEATVSE